MERATNSATKCQILALTSLTSGMTLSKSFNFLLFISEIFFKKFIIVILLPNKNHLHMDFFRKEKQFISNKECKIQKIFA